MTEKELLNFAAWVCENKPQLVERYLRENNSAPAKKAAAPKAKTTKKK